MLSVTRPWGEAVGRPFAPSYALKEGPSDY